MHPVRYATREESFSAVSQNGSNLRFCAKEWRKDPAIVLRAAMESKRAWSHALITPDDYKALLDLWQTVQKQANFPVDPPRDYAITSFLLANSMSTETGSKRSETLSKKQAEMLYHISCDGRWVDYSKTSSQPNESITTQPVLNTDVPANTIGAGAVTMLGRTGPNKSPDHSRS